MGDGTLREARPSGDSQGMHQNHQVDLNLSQTRPYRKLIRTHVAAPHSRTASSNIDLPWSRSLMGDANGYGVTSTDSDW
jgi:hypothetical protein